jgi:hypothetical protein
MSRAAAEIMAALPDDFVRRMRNWARHAAGSSLGYAQVKYDGEPSGGYREAPMPIMSGEADDTGAALQTLPIRYRRAVELWWAWEDTEVSVLARRCGGIDPKTYARRVMDGHGLLRSELARRHEAYRTHTARCAALTMRTIPSSMTN